MAGELENRRRGRGGNESGEGGVVERERGEASECIVIEEARKANGEQEQEVEGRWRTGCGAVWFGFRLQGFRICLFKAHKSSDAKGRGEGRARVLEAAAIVTVIPHLSLSEVKCSLPRVKSKLLGHPYCIYIFTPSELSQNLRGYF